MVGAVEKARNCSGFVSEDVRVRFIVNNFIGF